MALLVVLQRDEVVGRGVCCCATASFYQHTRRIVKNVAHTCSSSSLFFRRKWNNQQSHQWVLFADTLVLENVLPQAPSPFPQGSSYLQLRLVEAKTKEACHIFVILGSFKEQKRASFFKLILAGVFGVIIVVRVGREVVNLTQMWGFLEGCGF